MKIWQIKFVVITIICWGWDWLIEEQVHEFLIEKYMEIIRGISIMYKFMLIQILTLLVLLDSGMIGSTFIYL